MNILPLLFCRERRANKTAEVIQILIHLSIITPMSIQHMGGIRGKNRSQLRSLPPGQAELKNDMPELAEATQLLRATIMEPC